MEPCNFFDRKEVQNIEADSLTLLNTIKYIYTEYLAKIESSQCIVHFTGDCFHFLADFVERQTVYF